MSMKLERVRSVRVLGDWWDVTVGTFERGRYWTCFICRNAQARVWVSTRDIEIVCEAPE